MSHRAVTFISPSWPRASRILRRDLSASMAKMSVRPSIVWSETFTIAASLAVLEFLVFTLTATEVLKGRSSCDEPTRGRANQPTAVDPFPGVPGRRPVPGLVSRYAHQKKHQLP